MKRLFISFSLFILIFNVFGQDQEELIKEGNRLFNVGSFDKAKAIYKQVLNERKDDASVLYNIGNTEFKLKNYSDSIRYYLDALKLKPNEYLQRNLLYHLGNAQQGIAFENMQDKPKDKNYLQAVLPLLDSIEIKSTDLKQKSIQSKMLHDLKESANKGDEATFIKVFDSLNSMLSATNDKKLNETLQKISGLIKGSNSEDEKNKNKILEEKIEKVKKSISYYEESFQSYSKSLEVCRKIAIKEGRDVAEVGKFVKNNWAIARERWSLLHEVLNDLMKQNLKLKDGVQALISAQSNLFQSLEQLYLASQMQEVLEYTLKVLAEYHVDYKDDIKQLQKIAEADLNAKKNELENLKASQKQAAKGPEAEKPDNSKLEKDIENAQKIFDGLRTIEGMENYIEDGLKHSNLFESRRFSFQMIFFLKSISDFLNEGSPIERTFNEILLETNAVKKLVKESDEDKTEYIKEKDPLANIRQKKLKIASEKMADIEYMNEQLSAYLEDYIKDGSLKSSDKSAEESEVNKWLLTTLNDFVKSTIGKLVVDIKTSNTENKKIAESLIIENGDRTNLYNYDLNQNKNFLNFKNTLLGFVESIQAGIDYLDKLNLEEDLSTDDKSYLQLLDGKISFLLTAIGKEGAPEGLKNGLPYLTQRQQSFHEKLQEFYDNNSDKKSKQKIVKSIQKDFSQFIFMIDPMKTLGFKFTHLMKQNEEMFKELEKVEASKENIIENISEIYGYFDILIQNLTNIKEDDNKSSKDKSAENANKDEMLSNIKKSQFYLKQFEKSLHSIVKVNTSNFEQNSTLHKLFTFGLLEAAVRCQGQPNTAIDTLKFGIQFQNQQKSLTSAVVENRWRESISKDQLEYCIKYQQDLIELIGVRAINQVNKMREEFEKQTQSSAPSQSGQPTQNNKPDFDTALKYLKDVLTEGDKIVSFYEAKEFSNTNEKHDKVIDLLTKALEILNNKNQQDKNQDQDKQNQEQKGEEQKQEGQVGQSGNQNEKGNDNSKQERKPLEVSPEQARQLLNDLNKRDESQTKKDEKKKPINTPRPW